MLFLDGQKHCAKSGFAEVTRSGERLYNRNADSRQTKSSTCRVLATNASSVTRWWGQGNWSQRLLGVGTGCIVIRLDKVSSLYVS
ncbi:hypothetical protein Hypma_013952 [Hypsizygus marmoreus]|uniref:Uncharacterized protein n=1 Tax=Hypsizygus marmoreus TaxID=39966 RepID=A0A369KB38_HYPMA|nr:hypothetical protein Hypma_013952 [Hypsizygus marmoreus]